MSDDEISSCSSSTNTPPEIDDVDHAAVPPPFRAYIGGLSRSVGTEKLTQFLRECDPAVSHVHVAKTGNTGHCKGFAHASFSTEQMRQKAIANLTGKTFNGRKIRVEEAGEHFMVRRREEEGDNAKLKERRVKPAPVAKPAPVQDEWAGWDSWGQQNQGKVQQGTMKRWDPSQAQQKPMSKRRQELEAKKAAAVAAEDYALAGVIKKQLEEEDKIDVLRVKKQKAVEKEDFEEAGRLKKEIEAMEAGGPPPAAPAAPVAAKAAAPTPTTTTPAAAKPAAKEKPKKTGGCKRCEMGKPCGKHNSDGPRCKKCKEGVACMKHNPEAALKEAQLAQDKKGEKRSANDTPAEEKPVKKMKKSTPAVAKPGPKSMEELLGGSNPSAGFVASMDDDL